MPKPSALNIDIVRGDTFSHLLAFVEPGGRYVDDLHATNGSAVVTSAAAHFTADDEGKTLVLLTGSGIADGTTILSVDSPSQVTLDGAATADHTNGKATIRGLDLSTYVDYLSQVRAYEDATAVTVTVSVDASRDTVGVLVLSIAYTLTAALTDGGTWDIQGIDAGNNPTTIYAGAATLHLDTARS